MHVWSFTNNILFLDENDKELWVRPYLASRSGGLYSGPAFCQGRTDTYVCARARQLQITRDEVIAGRNRLAPVSAILRGVSAREVEIARLYQSVARIRSGLAIEPIDLTPSGLAAARHYFAEVQAARPGRFARTTSLHHIYPRPRPRP